MFNFYQHFLRLKSILQMSRKEHPAISRFIAKTKWVPSEIELQLGRAALLVDFEKDHNLPLEDFAYRANKSRQQILDEIQKGQLLALSIGSRGLKIPDWQLDPVKLQLTQSVLKHAAGVDSWTLYGALSKPLEGLCWRSPVEAVTVDTVNDISGHALNFLGFH
jgi:hypothetical protein